MTAPILLSFLLLIIAFSFIVPTCKGSVTTKNSSKRRTGSGGDDDTTNVDHATALIDWLHSKSGMFHPFLEIRRIDPEDEVSPLGMFTKKNIRKDTLMIEVPRGAMIISGPVEVGDQVQTEFDDGVSYEGEIKAVHQDGTYDVLYGDGDLYENVNRDFFYINGYDCGTVRYLKEQMVLGNESEYSAYANYLKSQPYGELPASWSEAGRKMLLGLLGQMSSYDNGLMKEGGLPPFGISDWIQGDWVTRCHGDPEDKLAAHAYFLVMQRGWDEVLIPVYDMMSHRNGKWLNTECNPVREGNSVQVRALRDIQAGEQIYTTYNLCADCVSRHTTYGSAEILRDYGFVEDFPQRWIFSIWGETIGFDLDEKVNDDGSVSGQLKVTWLDGIQSEKEVEWMQNHLRRLLELKGTHFATKDAEVPQHEWKTISKYHDALIVALSQAILDAGGQVDQECPSNETGLCAHTIAPSYDALKEKEEEWAQYRPITCDWFTSFHYEFWKTLEYIQSPYQRIGFHYNPYLRDTCFDLDDTTQICSSYRPHYHEMVVHHTAKYLENIKRVIFVGGGDSMLLHDILKYPTLELVVGLEIDQQVTRSAFKYYGTQPHWDSEKVEWWYGDATKSLLMLPKDYFGSFDLVLVDLSETVTALSVTEDLDVMEALALLVKPQGIVVKNEYMYFKELSGLFENTAHLFWDDVPLVCSQSLILGSNSVDFLRSKRYDHGVPYLYNMVDEEKSGNKIVRDYQKNLTSSRKHCLRNDELEKEPLQQERSPGILMIVEAENATIKVQSPTELRNLLAKAIVAEGLTVLSSLLSPANQNVSSVVLIMQEGYVIARHWPGRSYFAFDIHLWSHFDQQRSLKNSLIETVGSRVDGPSSSSYRIVAGGMFGLESWKDDEKNRGPRLTDKCERSADAVGKVLGNKDLIMSTLEQSTSLIDELDYIAVVLCGHQKMPCKSVELMRSLDEVREVIPLWTCPNLNGDGKVHDDIILHACEQDILTTLRSKISNDSSIRALIVDSSATYALTQIVHKIFTHPLHVLRWLGEDVMISAILLDETETWRRAFIHTFREEIVPEEPVFTGDVYFKSSKLSFAQCIMSSGDSHFVENLIEFADNVENATGLVAEVQSVRAGLFSYEDILEPSRIFMPNDFDLASPLAQWDKQEPLAVQTVLQLEGSNQAMLSWTSQKVSEALERSFQVATASLYPIDDAASQQRSAEDIGEGCVVAILWQAGSIIVLWDGRKHVDMNVFTYDDQKIDFAHRLVDEFRLSLTGLDLVLRDEQPRGVGRVVNFRRDLAPRLPPWWATKFDEFNVEDRTFQPNSWSSGGTGQNTGVEKSGQTNAGKRAHFTINTLDPGETMSSRV